jgi:hypothetical protein
MGNKVSFANTQDATIKLYRSTKRKWSKNHPRKRPQKPETFVTVKGGEKDEIGMFDCAYLILDRKIEKL